MTHFDQASFNSFILDNSVIGFFEEPITLKSGRKSSFYVNWRVVAEDVFLIDQLVDYVMAFVRAQSERHTFGVVPETFYGVPEGATKLGVLTQYKWAKSAPNFGKGSHVLPMGRRAMPKEHGVARDRHFVGMPRGATIVIEDVTTTGLSLLETIDKLVEAEVPIIAALGLTDRMERRDDGRTVAEAIASRSSFGKPVQYLSLSQADSLLPEAARRMKPSSNIIASVNREFEEFGTVPLHL